MKIFDKKIEGPNVELIVIPRGGDKKDIIFQAGAIMDYGPFDKMCPEPKPPMKIMGKTGKKEYNLDDAGYIVQRDRWTEQKVAWIVIESLKSTPGLTWDRVNPLNPKTWTLYADELKESGFSHAEVQRIINGAFTANCLNEQRVEEARANFLRGPQDQCNAESSGPQEEPVNTRSGVPANASA